MSVHKLSKDRMLLNTDVNMLNHKTVQIGSIVKYRCMWLSLVPLGLHIFHFILKMHFGEVHLLPVARCPPSVESYLWAVPAPCAHPLSLHGRSWHREWGLFTSSLAGSWTQKCCRTSTYSSEAILGL